MCPSFAFLFCLDPPWIGWGPPALVKAISSGEGKSTLLGLPIKNCQPLSETPSQTHPEKCLTRSSGHPLVQSRWHIQLTIMMYEYTSYWFWFSGKPWLIHSGPASIEQLGSVSAKSEEGSCHWGSGNLQEPLQAGCRGPERHTDQVKRLQTCSSLDQLRTCSKKQEERSGDGWLPLGQVLVGWEDHTPECWATRCSLDLSICHASPPPDGVVTGTSLQSNQEAEQMTGDLAPWRIKGASPSSQ